MSYPPIFILRHGQTQWNLQGRLQGHLDSPLTALGKTQAQDQRRLLMDIVEQHEPDCIYTSPLGRAVETAMIAGKGLGLPLQIDERLQEVDAGSWEGRERQSIFEELGKAPHEMTEFDLFLNAPGGERYQDLELRCRAFLSGLAQPTVVVTHGIIGSVLRGQLLGLSFREMDALERGQGCVYAIEDGQETCLRTSRVS